MRHALRRTPLRRGGVVKTNRTAAAPTNAEKPGPRLAHRGWTAWRLDSMFPSAEPRPRGAGIYFAPGHVVLPAVQQHVDETVPHLTRCSQSAAVVSVGPDFAAASEHAVDCLRDTDAESLHAPLERAASIGLDEEMHVVGLYAAVSKSKLITRRCRESAAQCLKDAFRSERRHAGHGAYRHVHGMATVESRSRTMRDARPRSRGLAAGTWPAAAPGPGR